MTKKEDTLKTNMTINMEMGYVKKIMRDADEEGVSNAEIVRRIIKKHYDKSE